MQFRLKSIDHYAATFAEGFARAPKIVSTDAVENGIHTVTGESRTSAIVYQRCDTLEIRPMETWMGQVYRSIEYRNSYFWASQRLILNQLEARNQRLDIPDGSFARFETISKAWPLLNIRAVLVR